MSVSTYLKGDNARQSVTLKLIAVAILVLIFLIPVSMVRGLIQERQFRQEGVAGEVGAAWGNAQTVVGPILVVPYYPLDKDNKINREQTEYAYFLPETVGVKGTVAVEVRARGIYDVPVYGTKLNIAGQFMAPALDRLRLTGAQMQWSQATVVLGLPDLRGVREQIRLQWAGSDRTSTPGVVGTAVSTGVSIPVPLALDQTNGLPQANIFYPFSLTLNIHGSNTLSFVPVGKDTVVSLQGNWPTPSFVGAFLPDTREVTERGFSASWHVLDLNRSLPQQWTSRENMPLDFGQMNNAPFKPPLDRWNSPEPQPVSLAAPTAFGVSMFLPVDIYQQSMRSAKYGIAVIALIFMVIFFVEFSGGRRVHPVQYVLIGLALVIYYTLLLSLSEYLRFWLAYLAASAAVIGMNTLFVRSVLKNTGRALLAGGILTVFYGFVYVLLQLEDYALLLGSIALFLILGTIMYLSRKIDWYNAKVNLPEDK